MARSDRFTQLALVFGNTNYGKLSNLPNASRDAKSIAGTLQELNFDVSLYTDQDCPGMQKAFEDFIGTLKRRGTTRMVVLYFAGHGYQERDCNYLLPVMKEGSPFGALSLQEMIDEIAEFSDQRLIFLDACRSYLDTEAVADELMRSRALPKDQRPNVAGGLAELDTDLDTFISFSASPGKPAYDGLPGRTLSPYADALIKFLDEPDLPLTVLMARVRNSVFFDTAGKQRTWDSSSLGNQYFFNPSSLLFLIGNAPAVVASVSSLAILAINICESSISEFAGAERNVFWVVIAAGIYCMTTAIFLLGVGQAYSRVRGARSEWQDKGAVLLFRFSRAAAYGLAGGLLGGVLAGPMVAIPYWWDWRASLPECRAYHWADPNLTDSCPRLGQLLVESTVTCIFVASVLGLLAMHLGEWTVRSTPRLLQSLGGRWRMLAGCVAGGTAAGVIIGPVVTAYFGSLDRPFLQPNALMFPSVLSVAVLAFCIVNYSLQRFTARRLLGSLLGAGLGVLVFFVLFAVVLSFLYAIGFIDFVLDWANEGFYHESLPMYRRYSFLLGAGLPYGIVFGCLFGVLIAATRLFSPEKRTDPSLYRADNAPAPAAAQ